ncbi:MAG: PDR/VanB family oxidoreductase [Pseudomonas sp.]
MFPVQVSAITREAEGILTFALSGLQNEALPAFSAGSHIDVLVPNGFVRQYSLCNDSSETHRYLIGVLHDPTSRGGSKGMHELLQEGDQLHISTPKNHFALVEDASKSLLLAGGIGITPLLCMAERLSHTGGDFEMHYCTRTLQRTAFYERIRSGSFVSKVAFHFDQEGPESRLNINDILAAQPGNCHLYVCGPKGFMDAMLNAAKTFGWPGDRLHYEFFSAEVVHEDGDSPFEVKLFSSGMVIQVQSDQTVVQALAGAGVDLPTSCEQGVCGTCLTRIIEGVPDHRDMFLTPEEQAKNDQFLPCCSRAQTSMLLLDL